MKGKKSMFFNAPGRPTKLKKAVYLFSSTILGVFLGCLVLELIEIYYLNWAAGRGGEVNFVCGGAIWPGISVAVWLLGGVGGFFLGRVWWRKIYVERIWAKRSKK